MVIVEGWLGRLARGTISRRRLTAVWWGGGAGKEGTISIRRVMVTASSCCLAQGQYNQFYETAVVDFYSAPDLILHYSNGNTCKDEWRRYGRWSFKGLRWEHVAYPMSEGDRSIKFTFEDLAFDNCESIMELDIPLGKFQGMTPEQVENYKRKNYIKFKDSQPKPSEEALLAAYKVPLPQPLSEPDIERILMAAYAIDF